MRVELSEKERELLVAAINDAVAHCHSQSFYVGAHGELEASHNWNKMAREYRVLLRKIET